ncbi:MAG: NAD-dependent epimerase/dehydratase family protein [bacterium]
MKILITGANGSLGTELLTRLRDSGNEIIVLAFDQNDTNNLKQFRSIKIIYGNVCQLSNDFLKQYLSDVDVFIHLAAVVHQPKAAKELYYQVNYEATKRLSDAYNKYSTSRIKQFIFISTVAVYGNYQSAEYSEDSASLPDTPYGESKQRAEDYLRSAFSNSSLKSTILRPATIYGGPNDKGNIARMIKILRRFHFFPLFDSGKTLKSFVYVGDVAQAIINCLNNQEAFGQIFNISAPPLSLKDIIKRLASKLGLRILTVPVPSFLLQMINPKSKLCQNNTYSFQKARRVFHYLPRTFPDGL